MPRATINPNICLGAYPAAGVTLSWTAADPANDHQCAFTGKEMILARNTGATPHNVTITSAVDTRGRTKDITNESLAAGSVHMFGPFSQPEGWKQASDGMLYFEADHAEIEFAVVRLP
jgi:hypothetical protein